MSGVLPDQVPWLAVRVCRSLASPEIDGREVFAGVLAAVIVPEAAEVALVLAPWLAAVTRTRNVSPSSLELVV